MDSLFWATGVLMWCMVLFSASMITGFFLYHLYRFIGLVVALSVLVKRHPKIVKEGHSTVGTILDQAFEGCFDKSLILHSFNRESVYFEFFGPFNWKIIDTSDRNS